MKVMELGPQHIGMTLFAENGYTIGELVATDVRDDGYIAVLTQFTEAIYHPEDIIRLES